MKVQRPLLGELTQGSIFTCALADRYECPVHGIVITARCDLAQSKFPLLNYIPIVPYEDWLATDGAEIVIARATAETLGSYKAALKSAGVAESLLNSYSTADLAQALQSDGTGGSAFGKRIVELAHKLNALELSSADVRSGAVDVAERFPKVFSGMSRELITGRLSGHYFLPNIHHDGTGEGYVGLLREVRHLPRELALALAKGLDLNDAELKKMWTGHMDGSHEDFAFPIGQLISPEIEHLLQAFALLFSRVGIEDLPAAYVDTMCSKKPRQVV